MLLSSTGCLPPRKRCSRSPLIELPPKALQSTSSRIDGLSSRLLTTLLKAASYCPLLASSPSLPTSPHHNPQQFVALRPPREPKLTNTPSRPTMHKARILMHQLFLLVRRSAYLEASDDEAAEDEVDAEDDRGWRRRSGADDGRRAGGRATCRKKNVRRDGQSIRQVVQRPRQQADHGKNGKRAQGRA